MAGSIPCACRNPRRGRRSLRLAPRRCWCDRQTSRPRFHHPQDLGRLETPARRHRADRQRAVGNQDVREHIGHPSNLKGTTPPEPIPRIVLADGLIGALIGLGQESSNLGWLPVAAFLEPGDGAFPLEGVQRLYVIVAGGLGPPIDYGVERIDPAHHRPPKLANTPAKAPSATISLA